MTILTTRIMYFNFCKSFTRNLSNLGKLNMKGILVKEFGGPEVCKYYTDLPIPEPNDNQIQIKVHAAGVNPLETYIRTGNHPMSSKLPFVPGFDSAGVITKLGKNVKNYKIGERVFVTSSDSGTYAEYAVSKPAHTFKLADELSFEEGSAIGIPFFTAYRALFLKGNARPGETVLIHGASGAVGLPAVQLAKAHGLRVIGTAGTDAGLQLVKSQGADFVLNHRDAAYVDNIKKLAPNGVDLILEMLANVNFNTDLQLAASKNARIMVIGNRGNIDVNLRPLMSKETTVTGVIVFATDDKEYNLMYEHMNAMLKKKIIKPVLSTKYDLKDASKAHHDIMSNTGAMGRLTLIIN